MESLTSPTRFDGEDEGEYVRKIKRIQNQLINSFVQGNTNDF
jgi:hypothetical protein